LVAYGLDRIDAQRDIRIVLLEGAPRVLASLPERISKAAHGLLEELLAPHGLPHGFSSSPCAALEIRSGRLAKTRVCTFEQHDADISVARRCDQVS